MEISKRDYFAAQALTGLLARNNHTLGGAEAHEQIVIEAFRYADVMLRHSKTLLDPVEIDPDKLALQDETVRLKDQGTV